MLSDRDYMRRSMEGKRSSFQLTGNQLLMMGLVGIFLVQKILESTINLPLDQIFGLVPSHVVLDFWIWQPATYHFFQGGRLLEFVFVLIGLFFFGPIVESRWGWKKYLLLFFSAGVFAGLIYTPIGFVFRHSNNTLLGAVPSVMGIMVMAAMIRPNMPVLLMFVFPMKMKYMIWLFIGIDLLLLFQNPVGEMAMVVPHLAGAAFGALYMYYQPSIDRFFTSLEPDRGTTAQSERLDEPFRRQTESPYSEEVDEILDKIHQQGINSLTQEERELLEQASDELKGEDRYESF